MKGEVIFCEIVVHGSGLLKISCLQPGSFFTSLIDGVPATLALKMSFPVQSEIDHSLRYKTPAIIRKSVFLG